MSMFSERKYVSLRTAVGLPVKRLWDCKPITRSVHRMCVNNSV